MTPQPDRLLNVPDAAERLGTGERFIRRLISERRIHYVKLGKHVRIAESVLDAYIEERTIEPVRTRRSRYGRAA
ncbi:MULTISPECIES: helix-turn-helix domain-containing protein [unclassified Streptomyces]|uniref:helix-turn-helix domain-containing protein n=1 Tax=unclassified Streptomyces TaxID=2593676 RepID=UPI001FAD0CE0|nr:helix-turn-helix domain-containing protein [Streptomyces sp. PBSH9]